MHCDPTSMSIIVAEIILCLDQLHHHPNKFFSGNPLLLQVGSAAWKPTDFLVSLFWFSLFFSCNTDWYLDPTIFLISVHICLLEHLRLMESLGIWIHNLTRNFAKKEII